MDTGLREVLDSSIRHLINDTRGLIWRKGLDQTMLSKWVWPKVEAYTLAHDSYLCTMFRHGKNWRPFPSQRVTGPYNFVGAAGPMEIKTTCPEQCRPQQHP